MSLSERASIPVQIRLHKRAVGRQYFGTVEFARLKFAFSVVYGERRPDGKIDSTLTWKNPGGRYTRIFQEISERFSHTIRECVLKYEEILNTLESYSWNPSTISGGAKGKDAKEIEKACIDLSFEFTVSKEIAALLKETLPD